MPGPTVSARRSSKLAAHSGVGTFGSWALHANLRDTYTSAVEPDGAKEASAERLLRSALSGIKKRESDAGVRWQRPDPGCHARSGYRSARLPHVRAGLQWDHN